MDLYANILINIIVLYINKICFIIYNNKILLLLLLYNIYIYIM